MLAMGPGGVYFYDGPERGVRKLTFDLAREDSVQTHVICSPLVSHSSSRRATSAGKSRSSSDTDTLIAT